MYKMTTQMVDKSNFDNKQYKTDLQCAYDCGYVKGQVDIIEKIKLEIQGLIDFEESCCGDTTLGYQCLGVVRDRISELKGETK